MNPANNDFPDKMSEGTSLEDIETGNVAHTADDAVMNAILSDMNAVEEAPAPTQPPIYIPPPPPPQQMPIPMPPPSYMQPQQQQHMDMQGGMDPMYNPFQGSTHATMFPPPSQAPSLYEPVQTQESVGSNTTKKNSWSVLFDELREPLFVGLLVTLFSLPALHTWLSKRLSWAYKVGGSLSWIGFLLQFSIVAGFFAMFRQIVKVVEGTA